MGMAASQVRLLQLTSRKNDIGFQLTKLANDKVSLARDMQKVSREYQNALNQKVLKWSNNQGVTYTDISYQNLMKPSAMNQNKPYLLTDTNGKIVLDNQYKKYAEMISPDGSAGGNWANNPNRTQILSDLTGFNVEDIDKFYAAEKTFFTEKTKISTLECNEPVVKRDSVNIKEFFSKLDLIYGTIATPDGDGIGIWWINDNVAGNRNLGDAYDDPNDDCTAWSSGTVWFERNDSDNENFTESIAAFFDTFITKCKEKGYFTQDELDRIWETRDTVISDWNFSLKKQFENGSQLNDADWGMGSALTAYDICESLLAHCMAKLNASGHEGIITKDSNDKFHINICDGVAYTTSKKRHDNWEAEHTNALASYQKAFEEYNSIFTSEQISLLDYYDAIFTSIADKGWTHNSQVNNSDYLNQMLQNNLYSMTTITEEEVYTKEKVMTFDAGYLSSDRIIIYNIDYRNSYSTDIASNFTQIFSMNDTDLREQALVDYEYEKSIISQKESRIDTRMQDLQTEQSAINQMLQGLETVKKENIDRTMNIFG